MELNSIEYYYNKFKYGQDIFHSLMQFRVRNILLVSTFYDAFSLEQDSKLSEELFGEYKHLELSNYPYIINVPTGEQAVKVLSEKKVDLVITLENIGRLTSVDLATFIKNTKTELPILLLLNKTSNPVNYESNIEMNKLFDGIFRWDGDAKVFLTMIKYIEDRKNLLHDTKQGMVRVILLYENSISYYSKFLSYIYYQLVEQTQRLIKEEYNDERKRLRMRARPKVILCNDINEAGQIYDNYKENISCVIASAYHTIKNEIPQWGNKYDKEPENLLNGLDLLTKIRNTDSHTTLMLHSEDQAVMPKAIALNSYFLYDESSTFWRDFKSFLYTSQGFGEFVFRNEKGQLINSAKSMHDFESKLQTIDQESLLYHAENNHFSTWLVAHGEFEVAKVVAPKKTEDFETIEDLRKYLIAVFEYVRKQKNRGKIVDFNEQSLKDSSQIVRLGYGSFGGKGRGLAFLNALLETMEFDDLIPEVSIEIPCTAIIGTDEFDYFIEHNKLNLDYSHLSDEEIDLRFVEGQLSEQLIEKLLIYIKKIKKPIAVRSSGLLEDSQSQPFAGVYRTIMLPNCHPEDHMRLQMLQKAIKLVFASIYLKNTRDYIEGINYKIEEEKMAVILQTVVGNRFGNEVFPHFSGVAQSYNYYPTSYIKHHDGIASLAVGLGKSVVDRERTLSFCPKYPKIDFMEPFKIVENSQKDFYALNLRCHDVDLTKGEDETLIKRRISKNDKEGPLISLTSVWDYENNRFLEGVFQKGPRTITFRAITHYNQYPMSDILNLLLEIGEKSMGIPVEIEFAVTLPNNRIQAKPNFYLLQIRPLNVYKEDLEINIDAVNKNELVLYSTYALGNGMLNDIYDIIYLDPEKFDNSKTIKMRDEIDHLNAIMKAENRQYILIGPGRWGSSDPHLGIPVKWGQINRAKVIVEVGLKNFIVEASQGSHFFQNVFAMDVKYLSVPYSSEKDFIDWEWFHKQSILHKTDHFCHIRTTNPLLVKVDGQKGAATIGKPLV